MTKKTPEEKAQTKIDKKLAIDSARIQLNLETQLKELRKQQIGTPTIYRKVGERVQRGLIKQSIIIEVLDDGKIYLLDEIYTDHNYGNPFDVTRKMYSGWHDVETYYTEEQIKNLPKFSYRDEVRVHYGNTSLSSLIHRYYNGTNLDPEYQRGDVWTLEDKQKLIDSMFNNIDIGKFTFIVLSVFESGFQWEILDGKQRLRSVIDFIEGKFQYRGVYFRDLHPHDRNHIESYNVLYADTEGLTDKQKCLYFLKLNISGKPQDPEHLAKVKKLMEAKP
jgi:hypothetical protein